MSSDHANVNSELRLMGQPPLEDLLDYLERHAVDGDRLDRAKLVDSWRSANDYYGKLEDEEAGYADEIELLDIDPSLDSLVAEIKSNFRYVNTFDTFPTDFAMVELDRLVLFQTYIFREHSESLQSTIGAQFTDEDLFRYCQPLDGKVAPVSIKKHGSRRYAFASQSTDFRIQEPRLLEADQVNDLRSFGPVSSVLALPVGFGSNFFTAIRFEDRVMLHNGYHRAHAMRAQGITLAPCIIQTVTRRDELEVAAKSQVADDPAFYFRSARPPLLKDFFDPKICREFKTYRTQKVIEISYEVREYDVRL